VDVGELWPSSYFAGKIETVLWEWLGCAGDWVPVQVEGPEHSAMERREDAAGMRLQQEILVPGDTGVSSNHRHPIHEEEGQRFTPCFCWQRCILLHSRRRGRNAKSSPAWASLYVFLSCHTGIKPFVQKLSMKCNSSLGFG